MSRNSSPPPKRPSRNRSDPANDFVAQLENGVAKAVGPIDAAVLAVSGGADSMAMLYGWLESRTLTKSLVVAHFDHRLRPESADDSEWVKDRAESLGIPCEVGVWENAGRGEKAARDARQRFLLNVAKKYRRSVATAHTRDDQAETILFRILRGTGVDGLKGIPRWRWVEEGRGFIRPMLDVPRRLSRAFLSDRGHEWREDASNATMDFARNRIRNELIPLLEERYNRQVINALLQLSDNAKEQRELVDLQVDRLWEPIAYRLNHRPDEVSIPRDAFEGMFPMEFKLVLRMLFRENHWPMGRMNADHWNRLASLIDAKSEESWEGPDGMSATMTPAEFTVRRKR
jgi:tRNA(Ile)-lysidine synthase